MAMEVSCSQCHGRLVIESPGVVFACPHCGAHVSTPLTDAESFSIPRSETADIRENSTRTSDPATVIARGVSPEVAPVETTIRSASKDNEPNFAWMSEAPTPPPTNSPNATSPYTVIDPAFSATNESADPHHKFQRGTGEDSTTSNFHFDPAGESDEVVRVGPVISEHLSTSITPTPLKIVPVFAVPDPAATQANLIVTSPVFSEMTASKRVAEYAKEEAGSRQTLLTMLLIVVGSYASLLTIYVVYMTLFSRTHQLESLPDLKTVPQRGGRAAVPGPENDLPPGHELKLGQTQRYGEIRVTALRVTKGPIAFTHYSGDATRERALSEPVLKLWLKFENVSARQTITPIDTTLMYFHRGLGDGEIASYNVIFPDTNLKKNKLRYFYNFDRMAADSEWVVVGQNANRALAPHESFETFVPSEENIEGLSSEMVWRVHVRKGHGPKTGNGVTTLIDVRFSSDEIKPDSV